MLVLARRVGEQIVIGKDIILTVLEIDRNKVRIGFVADEKIPIHRREILVEQNKTKGQS